MAVLRVRIFKDAQAEIEGLLGPPLPRWVERACAVARVPHAPPPPSIAVAAVGEMLMKRTEALSTLLRFAERQGWNARLDGSSLILATGLSPAAAEALMKVAGTWGIARRFAFKDASGEVLWDR